MEFSPCFKSNHHSLPSPDGLYIATLQPHGLQIRLTKTLEVFRTIILPPDFASRVSCIRWSPNPPPANSNSNTQPPQHTPHKASNPQPHHHPLHRILLADATTIRIYSLHYPQWSATITNPTSSGAEPTHIAFGPSSNDVLIVDAFGTKLKICFLDTGRSVEVRDPKVLGLRHGHALAYSYRPRTGHLALLTRPAAQDVVTLHAPGRYEVVGSFVVPMVDAQGVEWSKDGRWVGVWEAAGAGFKVGVYTADGHLYRCYYGAGGGGGEGEAGEDVRDGLGVRAIEWSPSGEYLAVAGYDGRVALLGTTTFAPALFLTHTATINFPRTPVWQEQISATAPPAKQRSYVLTTEPICPPPPQPTTANSPLTTAISLTAFNAPGTLLATRADSTPTTIWIWSLSPPLPSPAAILIQHSPVRTLQWHPTRPDLLLLHCANDARLVYLWSAEWESPRIVAMPFEKLGGRHEVSWVFTAVEQRPMLLCGDKWNCTVGRVGGDEGVDTTEEGVEVGGYERFFDEGASVDAARYGEALRDEMFDSNDGVSGRSWDLGPEVDDTFRFRRGVAS